jgi:hypothetical protein
MQSSSDWGIGNAGWLLDQMPYHYRHILIKLASGKTGEFTQDKIGESTDGKGGETTKLSRLIFALAGANYASSVDTTTKARTTTISEAKARSGSPSVISLRNTPKIPRAPRLLRRTKAKPRSSPKS